jgi:hypothetical protein
MKVELADQGDDAPSALTTGGDGEALGVPIIRCGHVHLPGATPEPFPGAVRRNRRIALGCPGTSCIWRDVIVLVLAVVFVAQTVTTER